jgi:glutamate carboxypeptidase
METILLTIVLKKVIMKYFVILFFLFPQLALSSLSSEEVKITQYIERQSETSYQLLKKIVEINSDSLNIQGVRQVGDVLKKELESLGLSTRWVKMPIEMGRAGHLFASTTGKSGKKILLIGHLDTVFEKNSAFQKLYKDGNYIYGPGVNDMKGGLVAIMFALKALKELGVLKDTQITVAFIGDEENPGEPIETARAELVSVAKGMDYALGFEYGMKSLNYATIARRGYNNWELKLKAKRGHSSRIYSKEFGVGANNLLALFLEEGMKAAQSIDGITFNPAIVSGGSELKINQQKHNATSSAKNNVIAESAYARGDIRNLTHQDYDNFKKKLMKIVDQLPEPKQAVLSFHEGAPPMAQKQGNLELLAKLSQVSEDLGFGKVQALDPKLRGAADTSYVADHVGGVIDGIGLLGDGAHSFEERIDAESFQKIMKRTAVLLYRLTR